jgi:dTDP-4-amino-4,6-dideoxygalactose transaminase
MGSETTSVSEIQFVDLRSEYAELRERILPAIERVLQRAAFIMGEEVELFEKAFAAYCGTRHAVGVANGTDALILTLKGAGLRPRDEVVLPVSTFIATAEAVVHCGARPVFVDIDPRTHHLSPSAAAKKITPRTRMIVPVHLYGQPVGMEPLLALAAKHNLTVIEDAAQAHGSTYRTGKAGSLGRAGCFSFYPSKNLGCYGDGGAIVTSDDALAETLRKLREHGGLKKYQHDLVGYNSRLDTVQAAILGVKLEFLDEWNEKRRRSAQLYNELLSDVPGVEIPGESEGVRHIYHLYVIQVQGELRGELQADLRARGIQTGIHYPFPLHLTPAFAFLGHRKGDFPAAEGVSDRVLSLPMHPYLQPSQVEYVAAQIADFMKRRA